MTSATRPSGATAARPDGPPFGGAEQGKLGAGLGRRVEHLHDAIAIRRERGDVALELVVPALELDVPRSERDDAEHGGEAHGGPDRSPEDADRGGRSLDGKRSTVGGRRRYRRRGWSGHGRGLSAGRALGVGRCRREDSLLEAGRRRNELDRLEQGRHDRVELGHLRVGLGARREVAPHRIGLSRPRARRARTPARGPRPPRRQAGEGVLSHGSSPSPPRGISAARMPWRPSRSRPFTVPSGTPVRSAISVWVRPPK